MFTRVIQCLAGSRCSIKLTVLGVSLPSPSFAQTGFQGTYEKGGGGWLQANLRSSVGTILTRSSRCETFERTCSAVMTGIR